MGVVRLSNAGIRDFQKVDNFLAGNQAFDPAPVFLTSAPLWLDASDTATITESGGSVSQWDNKGTGSDFVQATSAQQPTTGATTQNGLNVIDFSSDNMQHNGTVGEFKFMHDGTIYFIAGVFAHTSNGAINTILTTNGGGSQSIGMQFSADDRTDKEGLLISVGNGTNRALLLEDAGFFPGAFNIQTALFDLTAAAADRVDYFRNDTQGTNTTSDSNSVSTSDNGLKLKLGANNANLVPLIGSIGELIVVSGADATESNRQEVVDYLNAKWGIF